MEKLMSFTDHIRKLRPISETYIAPVEKVQNFFTEEIKLPSEVLSDYTHDLGLWQNVSYAILN